MAIVSLFCEIHDFFIVYEKHKAAHQLPASQRPETRGRPRTLHPSEVMTLLILFHQSDYRTLKAYYEKHVSHYLRWAFPNLVSYNRFVELQQEVLEALLVYLRTRFSTCDGVSFVDAAPVAVCHNRRIPTHRVFAEHASRSKNSVGWFYGFKLHLSVNTSGELLGVELTTATTDDRQVVPKLALGLFGKLYADKGYISQILREYLRTQGIDLVYKVRKNMKPEPLSDFDAMMLRKRMLIESVIKEIKTQTQLQHTRHRSFVNFQTNIVAALIAYTYLEKKPSLNLLECQQIKETTLSLKS